MKQVHLLAASALLVLAASEAAAGERAAGGGLRVTPPSHSNSSLRTDMSPACRNGCFSWERGRGFHRGHGFGGFIVVEREVPVIVEREVIVREVAAEPPAPPPPPREPYVVGRHYASLPGGCMKMIEGAASYYYCGGGEWYRPVGKQYRAIARP